MNTYNLSDREWPQIKLINCNQFSIEKAFENKLKYLLRDILGMYLSKLLEMSVWIVTKRINYKSYLI